MLKQKRNKKVAKSLKHIDIEMKGRVLYNIIENSGCPAEWSHGYSERTPWKEKMQ